MHYPPTPTPHSTARRAHRGDDDTLATEALPRSARQPPPAPRHAPPHRAYDKPVWWRPYLDETDKQILAFAATFGLGGLAALLAFALRWAWLQQ